MNYVHLHISAKTMEMPMCINWMLKQLDGKIERRNNMDNLTAQKKLKLISDCIASEDSVSKLHIDVRKMYAYLAEQAVNAETFSDINYLSIVKASLDFLVKGVKK